MKKSLLFLLCCIFFNNGWSQTEKDNLEAILQTKDYEARQYVQKTASSLAAKGDLLAAGDLHLRLGEHYELQKLEFDSAVEQYTLARQLYEKQGNEAYVAKAVQNLGLAYSGSNRLAESIKAFSKARELYFKVGNVEKGTAMYSNIGLVFSRLGKLDSAKYFLLQALLLCDSVPGIHCLNAQNNLGMVYMNSGEPDEAAKWYKKVIPVYLQQGDTLFLANTYNNLAGTYWAKQAFDSCIFFLEKASNLYSAINNPGGLNFCYVNLSGLYADQHEYEKSLLYASRAVQTSRAIDDTENLIYAYINAAKPASVLHSTARGQAFLDSALEIAQQEKLYLHLVNIYKSKVELARSVRDFEGSFLALEMQRAYEDSLSAKENRELLADMQTKYETREKEQQIALQKAEIEGQQAQIQRNMILLAALGLVLIFALLIGALLRNRALKRRELNRKETELGLKEALISAAISTEEKERTRFARDLHDGFGQMISVLNMNIKRLENLPAPATEERHHIFKSSETVLSDMHTELKNICFNLMPKTLIQYGLPAAIRELASRIEASGKVKFDCSFFELDQRLADVQEISLYRIVQEWTNNILKYSSASHIAVQVTKDDEEITLTIEDNGMGFDEQLLKQGRRNGWKNLQTRTNLMKGAIEVDTTEGRRGNMLTVNVPLTGTRAVTAREDAANSQPTTFGVS